MDNASAVKPIVVGVDGSPGSIDALRKAAELARALQLPLRAVTAWQFPVTYDGSLTETWVPETAARELLDSAIESAFDHEPPLALTTATVAGPSARSLITESEHASMLVVGSRGRGGFVGLLLGSVSTSCAQHAHCPVLIMRPVDEPGAAAASGTAHDHVGAVS
ncbi:universal stress protein [Microbacterium rhizomatis]|uniref:Universal stress protein n=1 Tax=Microbacterium rhizomatis TaxID=1631477 RepID=A0A5J5J5S1_9MICO|nr:universal stress protein [Microbacterium rhizomatis]KAA9111410.1 universal stress protein [Microbacterium rhizomatis]